MCVSHPMFTGLGSTDAAADAAALLLALLAMRAARRERWNVSFSVVVVAVVVGEDVPPSVVVVVDVVDRTIDDAEDAPRPMGAKPVAAPGDRAAERTNSMRAALPNLVIVIIIHAR